MKLVTFRFHESNLVVSSPRLGALLGNGEYILDFHKAFVAEGEHGGDLLSWFDLDGAWLPKCRKLYQTAIARPDSSDQYSEGLAVINRSQVQVLAPVPRPGKIICIGLNYRDHAAENNVPVPKSPVIFSKFTTSTLAPNGDVRLPAKSTQVDYEAELAVVIGRRTKNVSADRAYDYVLGYTNFNDVSARDFQFADGQWQRGKSCDTFAAFGEYITTTDEIPDPHKLSIKFRLNGNVMQDSNTNQLIFGVPPLIEFLSESITLEPGDIIATGTPSGVGFARTPPVFLKDGD
ncbi:MAG: fumarylacetoacetate hydrolase family protein, partial [Pyrinomonadaceae bacterium]